MKKLFFLILTFTLGSLPLFSQYYSDQEFVGTWERNQVEIDLRSDNSVKFKNSEGTVFYGTWENVLVWSGNPELRLSFGDSKYVYEVLGITGDQLRLKGTSDGNYYYYSKKYAGGNSSISAAEAGVMILGGLFLYSLFGDSGSDNSSYDSYDLDMERAKRDKQTEYDIRQSEAERRSNY